jgi:hypothetical protein
MYFQYIISRFLIHITYFQYTFPYFKYINYVLINHIWPVTSQHGEKVDHGPLSESMYTACSTQLTMGLACTLSLTREYMEQGGCLPATSTLTMYYLPVYPPYSDYNYGLRERESGAVSNDRKLSVGFCY